MYCEKKEEEFCKQNKPSFFCDFAFFIPIFFTHSLIGIPLFLRQVMVLVFKNGCEKGSRLAGTMDAELVKWFRLKNLYGK